MKTAIENGILCKYYYYPVLVNLEFDEQESYVKISKELLKYIDFETGRYKESEYVNNLLIKRKNIIHKAKNKLDALISIINKIGKDNFKKAFIYVPEGIEIDNIENEFIPKEFENETSKIIDNYLLEIYNHFKIKMSKFTGETNNRDLILNQFKSGNLDALLAMKCLDEGVDVPQTKYAIFCSSTGNPRQYIQRRGRVLRTHKDKEYAIIYDLIVKPSIGHTNTDVNLAKMEKNIFLSELRRLVNFAVLSKNKDQSLSDLEPLCNDLDIDIYALANTELNNYK
jgi:superfamily II DNA or RNA helicase